MKHSLREDVAFLILCIVSQSSTANKLASSQRNAFDVFSSMFGYIKTSVVFSQQSAHVVILMCTSNVSEQIKCNCLASHTDFFLFSVLLVVLFPGLKLKVYFIIFCKF